MRELFPVKLWLYLQTNKSVYGRNFSFQKGNIGFNKFIFVRKKLTFLNAGSRRSYIDMVWGQGRGILLNLVVGLELGLLFGTVYASDVYLDRFGSICI